MTLATWGHLTAMEVDASAKFQPFLYTSVSDSFSLAGTALSLPGNITLSRVHPFIHNARLHNIGIYIAYVPLSYLNDYEVIPFFSSTKSDTRVFLQNLWIYTVKPYYHTSTTPIFSPF